MNWPISWFDVKEHIDDIEDGINPELLPKGGVGYTEPGKVITFNGDATGKNVFTFNGFKYAHISNTVIDANKIAKVACVFGGVAYESTDIQIIELNDKLRAVEAVIQGNSMRVALISEYDTETYKTGVSFFYDPNGEIVGYPTWVSRIVLPETIHPIDPKYLSMVVDFDQLGVTDFITGLYASGGGAITVGVGTDYDVDTEAICESFPLDRPYTVKMTIDGMGVMLVNPVYTLKDANDMFIVAHFDSYLQNGDGLVKFYVRICRLSDYESVRIIVGFY